MGHLLDNKPVFMFYSLYVLSPPLPPPRSMLGLTPKRSDSSNFMANGNNIEKGARGMEMFPTWKGIRRSLPLKVLKVIASQIQSWSMSWNMTCAVHVHQL